MKNTQMIKSVTNLSQPELKLKSINNRIESNRAEKASQEIKHRTSDTKIKITIFRESLRTDMNSRERETFPGKEKANRAIKQENQREREPFRERQTERVVMRGFVSWARNGPLCETEKYLGPTVLIQRRYI
jgi:hypothetical protein